MATELSWVLMLYFILVLSVSTSQGLSISEYDNYPLELQVKLLTKEVKRLKEDIPDVEKRLAYELAIHREETAKAINHMRTVESELERVKSELRYTKIRDYQMKMRYIRLVEEIEAIKKDRQVCDAQLKRDSASDLKNAILQTNSVKGDANLTFGEIIILKQDFAALKTNLTSFVGHIFDSVQESLDTMTSNVAMLNYTQAELLANISQLPDRFGGCCKERPHSPHNGVPGSETEVLGRRKVPHMRSGDQTVSSIQPPITPPPRPAALDERSRLLIAEFWSFVTNQRLHQLSIADNELTRFPGLTNGITALAYDPTRNSILFVDDKYKRINSVSLEGVNSKVIKQNIGSYGLTVDGHRGIVFVSTYQPSKSIMKMDTDGENEAFVVEATTDTPAGITIDSVSRVVYFCVHTDLFSVSYDGTNLQKIPTRRRNKNYITGVALDIVLGELYYNVGPKIFKYSISEERHVKVGQVEGQTRHLQFYNGTVFISSYAGGDVYALYRNTSLEKIAQVDERSVICLIP